MTTEQPPPQPLPPAPQYIVLHKPRSTNHVLHLLLSLITLGLWIPIWIVMTLSHKAANFADTPRAPETPEQRAQTTRNVRIGLWCGGGFFVLFLCGSLWNGAPGAVGVVPVIAALGGGVWYLVRHPVMVRPKPRPPAPAPATLPAAPVDRAPSEQATDLAADWIRMRHGREPLDQAEVHQVARTMFRND